ncbi:TetR/AcrR family transcriptional regulator [Rhodococcus sp. KRD197]|uniref:TetR/AcrR family transcriptional regulator n=1 Tax=Rhodococcus sp. KRD197 TaxID=2729731 RepID=UPI0019D00865|nr:TetR/AcrR family transcriptional regulator [Rhodococcus sp. KRD197]
MTQERAVKTRAALIAGAAREFANYGYAASSVNRILDTTGCTKGAMYFHFASKQELAEAVLDAAATVYSTIATRWATEVDVHSLDAIAGLVDDAATAFSDEPALRAEARLSLEPEFIDRRPTLAWEEAAVQLAAEADELECLRNGFTAEKFGRVLAVSLAGHRLLAHIVPVGVTASVRSGYTESLDTVVAAAATKTAPTRHLVYARGIIV